jgi:predicted nucleic acid-binding protein
LHHFESLRVTFSDTSFWMALLNRRDDHNALAREAHADRGVLTTNHIRGETLTVLRRRAGHRHARAFLDALSAAGRVALVDVAPDLGDEALRWLRRHDERPYSFVDATSFRVMRHHGLTDALAFDGDFSAAGFVELRA